jgi:cytidylate kinase
MASLQRRTICISHATGAGGATVGRAVAEQLGFRYVDDEVISEAAEWAELDPAFVADAERRKPFIARLLGSAAEKGSAAPRLTSADSARALPTDADVRRLITAAVTSVAREGSVVIVAHAASFAVAGAEVLRVLVTASPETRVRRIAADRGTDEEKAERQLKAEDAGRADYLRRFYGIEQELPTHFDLVVNMDTLTPTDAADIIIAAS